MEMPQVGDMVPVQRYQGAVGGMSIGPHFRKIVICEYEVLDAYELVADESGIVLLRNSRRLFMVGRWNKFKPYVFQVVQFQDRSYIDYIENLLNEAV